MSDDDTYLSTLAAELGAAPPAPGDVERLRRLAQASDPWGPVPDLAPDLALARLRRRHAGERRTRRRAALLLSTAAALAVSFTPTLVRWRVDRPGPGTPGDLRLNQVGMIFFTSSGY